jgi:hypothetical protein
MVSDYTSKLKSQLSAPGQETPMFAGRQLTV